jgi:hypothetical protein
MSDELLMIDAGPTVRVGPEAPCQPSSKLIIGILLEAVAQARPRKPPSCSAI